MTLDRTACLLLAPASLTICSGITARLIRSQLAAQTACRLVRPAIRMRLPVFPRIAAVNLHIAKRVNDLRPSVKFRLQEAMSRLPQGVTLLVTSAARTHAEQARLRSTFGVKARPGTSCHEDGRAVDLNVLVDGQRVPVRDQHRIIGAAMASEGFQYLGPRDPVHYSVPRDEVDTSLLHGPSLEVCTMGDVEKIALTAQLAVQPAVPGGENPGAQGSIEPRRAVNN